MPNYVKFMRDILLKKCRLGEFETLALIEGCITMLMNKLPPKLKDLGSFTIPCSIGNNYVGKALCDLGASINLMPMSIFRKLGIGKVRPITVTLQLVDRSYVHLECRTLIDVHKGKLTLRVYDQHVTFNVLDALRCVDVNDECHAIEVIETTVEEFTRYYHNNSNSDEGSIEQSDTVSLEEFSEFMVAK
ncbi:uncharacterized protein [Gossypium hirsutum]|uniref:Aspartic peptidase DDI1-type domain-containing protein n=1 Tax=Gossypium hirsutum TaxID=3635 RepID=A0A1U8NFM8_GOSHI|nr:uncharacterized protein LOC107947786 [Gossypium hirsutum]